MTEVTFWILTALVAKTRHGYAILRDVEELTSGEVSLRISTLYSTLERLERDGRVRRAGDDVVDGRARRYYELTDEGRGDLEAETERLASKLRAAETRLGAHRLGTTRPAPATMSWSGAW